MEKQYFKSLNETLYVDQLENGLSIYVFQKKGFQKTYATFTTEYGSIDRSFTVNGESFEMPDGIAHFLEHKMFEEEEGDVFQKFAENGAQTNAFTSFDRTAYLFSSTKNIKENIETLLNFVQTPYLTNENVEKEKGIIEQEIRMYEDNPDWRLYFGLIQSLYESLPIRKDIAGSVESIYQITKDNLYKCYNTFYHPSNMVLFIVSGNEPEEIMQIIKKNQATKSFSDIPKINKNYPEETKEINEPKKEINLSVALPKVLIGYKDTQVGFKGKDFIKQEFSTKILLDIIFGQSSTFYEEVLNKGVVDDEFSFDYQLESQYAFSIIGGSSKNPERLVDMIKDEVNYRRSNGIDDKIFQLIKKKKLGDFLRKINSHEFIANQFTRYIFNQANLFDILLVLEDMVVADVTQRLDHFNNDLMSVSIIRPIEGE